MSTAKSSLINRLVSVAATETDLQKLSYAAKGLEALLPGTDTDYPGYYGVSWDESTDTFTQVGSSTAHAPCRFNRACAVVCSTTPAK